MWSSKHRRLAVTLDTNASYFRVFHRIPPHLYRLVVLLNFPLESSAHTDTVLRVIPDVIERPLS